ncbi:MAG: hypothetical protein RBU30_00710 [Polyangia bacterium]|jgi:endonuclease/exonuclease/phosphatase family metal-dependent hydrolase|nr:hypothetical protein [Polyangia bacterium]
MNRHVVLAASLLAFAACSDDDDNQNNNSPTELRVVTYNGGLARGFVAWADERAPLVTQAVANLEADVVCVQEIWLPEHVTQLSADATEPFPNQIYLEPYPDPNPGEPACDATEVEPLLDCFDEHCANATADEIVSCVLDYCRTEFNALSGVCQSCLAANIGSTVPEMMAACAEGTEAYAYGGSFGIGLLTNQTIAARDHIVMESSLNRRGVIYAQLETPLFGTVHVFCTHLTAVFGDIPFPHEEGSWTEEQAAQVTEMRAWVDQKAGTSGKVILLGDFNCGPGGQGFVPEIEANYDALSAGYTNVYFGMSGATCTFCDENPLNGGIDHGESVLIDHVLLRGFAANSIAERILTEDISFTVDASNIQTKLSDHYGVRAILRPLAD